MKPVQNQPKTTTEPQRNLIKAISDIRATWVFLFVFYEFRYNPNTKMFEAREKQGIPRPCATNLSIRNDFTPLDKPILYTWSQYLKRRNVNASMRAIIILIKFHLRAGNVIVRTKPKWTLGRNLTGYR